MALKSEISNPLISSKANKNTVKISEIVVIVIFTVVMHSIVIVI